MLTAHTLATLAIAGWWLVLAGSLLGVGLLLFRLARLGALDSFKLILAFWSGWAAVVALLQIWHLALPVNGLALAFVGALGLTGLVLEARALIGLAAAALRAAPAAVLLCGGLLLWAANRSTGPVQNYDTGLYYMPTHLTQYKRSHRTLVQRALCLWDSLKFLEGVERTSECLSIQLRFERKVVELGLHFEPFKLDVAFECREEMVGLCGNGVRW